jgi:hypothetical protein
VVISIRVNINQKSLVIEEILSQRKQTIAAIAENLMKEVKFDVKLISDSVCSLAGLQVELDIMKRRDPRWFNADSNFKLALGRFLDLKEDAVSNFVKAEPSLREGKVCFVSSPSTS